jgi:hypothetical protein
MHIPELVGPPDGALFHSEHSPQHTKLALVLDLPKRIAGSNGPPPTGSLLLSADLWPSTCKLVATLRIRYMDED